MPFLIIALFGVMIYAMIGVLASVISDSPDSEIVGFMFFWPVILVVVAVKGFVHTIRRLC